MIKDIESFRNDTHFLVAPQQIKPKAMIKQDYLLRMIQEIVTLIVNALLNKKKIKEQDWKEYDAVATQILGFSTGNLQDMETEEIVDLYKDTPDKWEKIELASILLLKLSDEMNDEQLVLKSKLKQNGIDLLEKVQTNSPNFSLQRIQLLELIKNRL